MTRQQFVDNVILDAFSYEWGISKLTRKCDSLICSGHCSGRNANCVSCPIPDGKEKLAEIFGRLNAPEPPIQVYQVHHQIKTPENVFTFKGNTFRWV